MIRLRNPRAWATGVAVAASASVGWSCFGHAADEPAKLAANAQPVAAAIPPALELPAGGIIFSARERTAVEQETLTIGLDRIEIDYLVRNLSAEPQSLAMAFPLPTIDMANLYGADLAIPAYAPANPTNFVGFWTTLNGVAVEPDVDQRALAIGQVEATKTLKALDLPLYPLDAGLAEKLANLTYEQRQSLRSANLIDIDAGLAEPLWALRTVFHWQHTLGADAVVAIKHHYKPIAGSAPWSETVKAKAKTKYCMRDEDIAAIDQQSADGKAPTVYWVHYAPGNNSWLKGQSRSHTLVIERPDGKGRAATCAAGAREMLETNVRIVNTGRTDDVDIEVMFVE